MKKIKKTLTCSFGAFIAFIFSKSTTLAQIMPMYGVDLPREMKEPTLWEKILSVIFSPLFIIIMVVIVLVTGTIIFIKRKRKNAQRNS